MPDAETKRIVSMWIQDADVALFLVDIEGETICPLESWQLGQENLVYGFADQINRWDKVQEIDKIVANSLPDVPDESHPANRMMEDKNVGIIPAIHPAEGRLSWHEKQYKSVDLSKYSKPKKLEELISRLNGKEPNPLVMAFFQAVTNPKDEIDKQADRLEAMS